jgi:hypothetical protein
MKHARRLLAAALLHLTAGCMAYEPAAELRVRDPRLVSLETFAGDPLLPRGSRVAGIPGRDVIATRASDGAIEVDGRTIVASDGDVSGVRSLDDLRATNEVDLPVCYAFHRGGCRHVRVNTPTDNVALLRSWERPERFVGVMELLVASGLVGAGYLSRDPSPHAPTTSGEGILITSGAILALVGAFQTFGANRNESVILGAVK